MAAIQSPPPPPPAPKAKQPFLSRSPSQSAKGWGAHNANLHATIAAKQAKKKKKRKERVFKKEAQICRVTSPLVWPHQSHSLTTYQ